MSGKNPEEWLDDHGDELYRYALLRVRRSEVAEDLVQDTLVSAIKAHDTFEGKSALRTWLISILRRKIVDHFRSQSKEPNQIRMDASEDFDRAFFDAGGQWKQRSAKWPGHSRQLTQDQEFWAAFSQCLAKLPASIANTFCLREMEGLASDEVCKVLAISPSNLWTQLYRARMLLRKCLEENWLLREQKTQ